MSIVSLNAIVTKAVVSDRFRDGILNGRKAELIRDFDLDADEVAAIMSIHADSLAEFAAAIDELVRAREIASPAQPGIGMHQRTILLADNDQDILTLYRLALKRKSEWNIFSAADGPLALMQARDIQPDLIVLDVMLAGGMSGIEVCRQLTSQSSTARVPVVMVSALNDPEIFQAARAAGARGFWTKPVPPIQFVEQLEELMAGGG
jgi:CheY-like chemotaxis protein